MALLSLGLQISNSKPISQETISKTKKELIGKISSLKNQYKEKIVLQRIAKCIPQFAKFVEKNEMTEEEFRLYTLENFAITDASLDSILADFSKYYHYSSGHLNQMGLELKYKTQLDSGGISKLDDLFSNYDPYAHLIEDWKKLGIGNLIVLNFPRYSLEEKNSFGENWTDNDWAYARLAEIFSSDVPADVLADITKAQTVADAYIANYYIYMGSIKFKNEKLFPKDLKLISHWNLRDELKSNYAKENGKAKQDAIYEIMKHIVNQTIPSQVINNSSLEWDINKNKITDNNGKELQSSPEPNNRYKQLLSNFNAIKKADKYYGNTYFQRKFESEYEMSQPEMEELFRNFLSSDVVKEVGTLIKKKLGRNLEPYDIWYDGFKARGSINEADLDIITKNRFQTASDFKANLPSILIKLGFNVNIMTLINRNVEVDPSRGAGHASGSESIRFPARLRTHIGQDGMDYKGYNIAVHEFGHNVEQTFSLHRTSNYMLRGVPNNAFTEAIAFTFQTKDLKLLDLDNQTPESHSNYVLDNFWNTYEIMGVALVDQLVWKWLYSQENPSEEATNQAVNRIAKEVWNSYYAPVIGVKDSPILGIYSHMIDYPLYLSAYPLGHLIEFQLEDNFKGKNFGAEIERVTTIGRLTPKYWMIKAVGSEISSKPMIGSAIEALKNLKAK